MPPAAMPPRATALLVSAILCLLATAAAAAAAPKGYASPTFHKYMIDTRFGQLPQSSAAAAGGKASVASTAQDAAAAIPAIASEADYYNQYGYNNYRESKQVCLAEQRQRNCAMYGCQDSVTRNGCDNTGGGGAGCGGLTGGCSCYNCRSGNTYSSDFTCMREEHYYSGYGDNGPTNFFQTHGMVGSCDWSIMWLRKDRSDTGGNNGATCSTSGVSDDMCGWQPAQGGYTFAGTKTFKVGTATANCYLNAEAQTCGEPLCNRMMVTLQGDVYVSQAYSHDDTEGNEDNRSGLDACYCFSWDNIDNDDCSFTTIPPWSDARRRVGDRSNATVAPDAVPAGATRAERNAARRAARANQGRQNEAGAKVEAANYGYNNYNHAAANQAVYWGGAVIISGAVTSINGQAYESKYEDGLFEYVPYYYTDCQVGVDGGCPSFDATLPFVKPLSYKMEFSKDGDKYYSN